METEGYEIEGACTRFRYAVLGLIQTNVYVLDDGAGGRIVCDPADSAEAIMSLVGDAPVSAIFVTHRHNDHIGALARLKELTGAAVHAPRIEAPRIEDTQPAYGVMADPCKVDVALDDGDVVEIGATQWQVMHTPGHTEGSICYYLDPTHAPNPQGKPLLLSGDTLFHGTIGRTDLEGGNMDEMRASLRKLGALPDETVVLPGHNSLTSIGTERWRVIDFLGNGGQV